MGYSALARVLTGWTGTIEVDGVTVTPRTRESVCSLMARVVHDVLVQAGRRITIDISDAGVLTIASTSSFDMTLTSGVETRTGFTAGPYSGASSYTAASGYTTAYVPARGLRVEGALLATTRGSVVGDGSGASAPRRISTSTRLVIWDDQLQMPTWAAYDWDVWHGERWFGRFAVESARRVPLGSLRSTDNITFEVDVREVAAGEVVQTAPEIDHATNLPLVPDAAGWLLGYVRTDAPGYRTFTAGGSPYTVASGTYRFDAFLAAMNTAVDGGVGETVTTWAPWGGFDYGAASVAIESADDRIGWLIGAGFDATETPASSQARPWFVPPAGIPLMGLSWEQVETDEDRRVILDESLRNQGYAWGSALLWRCTLTMHRYAFEALQTGWCLNGRVCLAGKNKLSDPISNSDPQGYIDGYVVGDPQVVWQGKQQLTAVVQMTIASG